MLLDVDPEDHTEATIPLAYTYIAMEEYESFDDIINDVNDKYIDKVILTLWSEFRRTGTLPMASSEAAQPLPGPIMTNSPSGSIPSVTLTCRRYVPKALPKRLARTVAPDRTFVVALPGFRRGLPEGVRPREEDSVREFFSIENDDIFLG